MLENEFFSKYKLNKMQEEALKETDGAILVTAGAGSGKTRLLTHRIAYLMMVKNVNPYNILAITFTNKAANEMKTRVIDMVESGRDVFISTFHSMCAQLLRRHISRLSSSYTRDFTIYSETDADKVIKDILTEMNISDESFKKNVKYHISACKNENLSIDLYERYISYDAHCKDIINVFRRYEETLQKNNALDFDDLLCKCYDLLIKDEEILYHYTNRFRYILVDEFQDTNNIQFALVNLLASVHKNIFAVGDEDQCIYTWRGANFKNMADFQKIYPDYKLFKLEQNYRSTKEILLVANNVIKNNSTRFDKVLWTDKEGEDCISYTTYSSEKDEAENIAHKIHRMVSSGKYKYGDFAILMRVNALSFPFEEKLLNYNIPHLIYGGFKFFERQEIKNVLSYLRLFINVKDDIALKRIVNFPKRGIGDSSIQKLAILADEENVSMLEYLLNIQDFSTCEPTVKKFEQFVKIYKQASEEFTKLNLVDFVNFVIDTFKIKLAYQEKKEDLEKSMNIDVFIKSVYDFSQSNEEATLGDYLQNVSLISDIDTEESEEKNNVIISSVHSVKGLEFKCVFLVGLEEGIFPLSRAIQEPSELEEERRLMYVAITRAEEKLFMSSCDTRYLYGRQSYMKQSRFLGETQLEIKKKPKIFEDVYTKPKETYAPTFNVSKISTKKIDDIIEKKNSISIFKVGQTVLHTKFGVGTVESIDIVAKFIDVNFVGIGRKTLLAEIAPLKIIKE